MKNRFVKTIIIGGFIILFLFLVSSIFIIYPNERGVRINNSTGKIESLENGFHIKSFFKYSYWKYSTELYYLESIPVPVMDCEGKKYQIDVSLRYKINPQSIDIFYKNLGGAGIEKLNSILVIPEVKKAALMAGSMFNLSLHDRTSHTYVNVWENLNKILSENLEEYGVFVDSVIVERILVLGNYF